MEQVKICAKIMIMQAESIKCHQRYRLTILFIGSQPWLQWEPPGHFLKVLLHLGLILGGSGLSGLEWSPAIGYLEIFPKDSIGSQRREPLPCCSRQWTCGDLVKTQILSQQMWLGPEALHFYQEPKCCLCCRSQDCTWSDSASLEQLSSTLAFISIPLPSWPPDQLSQGRSRFWTLSQHSRVCVAPINAYLWQFQMLELEIRVPARSGSWRGPSSGLCPQMVLRDGCRNKERGREREGSGVSSHKGTNPILRAPPLQPHLNLVTSSRPHL